MATVEPVINTWYRSPETKETFVVIGVDEDGETVATQDIDGEVREISFDKWYDTGFEAIDPPDDDWDSEGADELDDDDEVDEEDDDWDEEIDGMEEDDDWGDNNWDKDIDNER
jgi:hypothetical protein